MNTLRFCLPENVLVSSLTLEGQFCQIILIWRIVTVFFFFFFSFSTPNVLAHYLWLPNFLGEIWLSFLRIHCVWQVTSVLLLLKLSLSLPFINRIIMFPGVVYVCMHLQSCLTLCNPMDYSLPGSSVHEIFQARILEWIAILYSRGSFQSRDRTCVSCVSCISCTGSLILYNCATWEALLMLYSLATRNSLSFLEAYICVFYKVWEAFGHYKNFHGSVN